MDNKKYFICGLKALSIQFAFGLAYIIGEPRITASWWIGLHPMVKFVVFLICMLVLPAPFTKEFRQEMSRRKMLKESRED